jgi:hypothetical protein
MITKIYRNMLNEFVTKTNKHLDLKKEETIVLTFYELSNFCYRCSISQFGKIIVDDITNPDFVLMYVYGYAMALSDLGVFEIWEKIIRFDHIINKRL